MKKILVVACAAALLAGCQTVETKPAKTALQIQAIQARNFEADKPTAFRSVTSVLQDLGYTIQAADLNTGIITAQSPTTQDKSSEASWAAAFGGVRTEGKTQVTATVEEFGAKQARVRLNFVDKRFRSARNGQTATDEQAVHDPVIYANAFEKIGEAIFVRAAQR